MPTTPYLKDHAFRPETVQVQVMGMAFEKACRSLGLVERTDPATEAVAALVIERAQDGEHDPIGYVQPSSSGTSRANEAASAILYPRGLSHSRPPMPAAYTQCIHTRGNAGLP